MDETPTVGREASIPNPALKDLAPLIGEWQTTGHHALMPDTTFHGRVSWAWIEGGAFMMMRTEIDEPGIPSGISIFGSDDATGQFFMLYFDERGISRKYDVAISEKHITWWRDDPTFSQRATLTIEDSNHIVSKGEMSRDGAEWESDLALTYSRIT